MVSSASGFALYVAWRVYLTLYKVVEFVSNIGRMRMHDQSHINKAGSMPANILALSHLTTL